GAVAVSRRAVSVSPAFVDEILEFLLERALVDLGAAADGDTLDRHRIDQGVLRTKMPTHQGGELSHHRRRARRRARTLAAERPRRRVARGKGLRVPFVFFFNDTRTTEKALAGLQFARDLGVLRVVAIDDDIK